MSLSNREKFIRDSMSISEDVVLLISDIGKKLNTNKYNVWIARESKKHPDILENYQLISNIVDWAKSTKSNIMKFDLDQAKKDQDDWHNDIGSKIRGKIESSEIDQERVMYVTDDGRFFFYMLDPEDLEYEGNKMHHCIGDGAQQDQNYAKKIKDKISQIVSLRDDDNIPHVTIEIEISTKTTLQIQGRGGSDVSIKDKFYKAMSEFIVFAGSLDEVEDDKIYDIIKKNLNY